MIAALRPGVTLPQGAAVIGTERLRLRQGRDMAPYAAMLSDPGTARFVTVDGKPVVDEMTGWRHTVVNCGHWVIHGAGMFVVEEKSSGRGGRRAGRGFEVGWGIAKEFRGKGYALEAARASVDWAFATFDIDEISHCIDCENLASQGAARRLRAPKSAKSNCSAIPPISG